MNNPTFEKFDLTGKKALVTGGGTGLGYNMARSLASLGATVMIASRNEEVLESSAKKLMSEPQIDKVLYHRTDLVSREQTTELAKHAIAEMGGVDIFIGNAAQDILQYTHEIDNNNIDDIVRINLQSNIELTREFLPHMREKKWGRVIYSTSISAVCGPPHPGFGVYASTKGALNAFTRVVASEQGRHGITANSLIIGLFPTKMVVDAMDDLRNEMGQEAVDGALGGMQMMTPAGRMGDCEEIEGITQLLCSDAGKFITGTNTVIDGGISMMMTPDPLETWDSLHAESE